MSLTFQTELDNEPIQFPTPENEDERKRLEDLIEAAEEVESITESTFGAAMRDLRFALESVRDGTSTSMARVRDVLDDLNAVCNLVTDQASVSGDNLFELYDGPLSGKGDADAEARPKAREEFRKRVARLERSLDMADAELARTLSPESEMED